MILRIVTLLCFNGKLKMYVVWEYPMKKDFPKFELNKISSFATKAEMIFFSVVVGFFFLFLVFEVL